MNSVAFFSMPREGHLRRLLPLVSGIASRGIAAHVFTDERFAPAVRAAGGEFVDLFGRYPLEGVDPGSFPVALQSVAYAARHAGDVMRDLGDLRPSLVVYDTFALIARVAAIQLGIPYVNVCAGHNVDPQAFQQILAGDPRVVVSAACRSAVVTLRDRYGMRDATPFSYVDGISPWLNVYAEPPEYLTDVERRVFEPVVFFGSLPSTAEISARPRERAAAHFPSGESTLRIYVSFGTVAWRSYPGVALAALECIAGAVAGLPHARAVISLGGADFDAAAVRRLARANVTVESHVDQWSILEEADLFVTHHGLNSTHEAVFHGVPMLSYPFFWDQPSLAAKCAAMGLAVPLADGARSPLTAADVLGAIDRVTRDREGFRARLALAREYELRVMAGRDAVIERLLALR